MTVAYQMPVRTELASRVGPRLWRKTILKTGHISKGGIELDVDRAYLEEIIKNFTAGAKDQVQFVLGHDENPEKFRGELRGLEIANENELVGLFETTTAGSQMIEDNPRLGASVAVLDNFERADGRKYGPTLLHVAATLDPEVAGLGNWARAELSAKTQIIDLSAQDGKETESRGDPVASLTDEQVSKLLKLIEGDGKSPGADDKKTDVKDETKSETKDECKNETQSKVDSKKEDESSEDELDDMTKTADEIEGKDNNSKKPELIAAGADDEDNEALLLANARIDAQEMRIAHLQRERDDERFKAEKEDLARNFGIPQDVVELARPVLHGTGHTLELSAGKQVDVGQVMRKVLHELGRRYAKALDLGAEYGTADAEDVATKRQADTDAFIARAKSEFRH